MTQPFDIQAIQNATAYDADGDKVGSVDQVYLDDATGDPNWVTVTTGWFGTSQSFVPLEGASLDDEALRLPHPKDKIKDAPRIEADHHLEPQEEDELYRYYGLEAGPSTTDLSDTADHDRGTSGQVGDDASVTLSEERLSVDKQTQEAGRVRLRKYVTTEEQQVTVPVMKEKLVVERNPVDGDRATGEITEGEEVEEITLREERAVVGKETVDVEEVRVGKEQVTEHQEVSEQVRKEHVDVDVDGDVDRA